VFSEKISCYGRLWKGLGFSEEAVRIVSGIFDFLKKLFGVQKFDFRVVSPKILSESNFIELRPS
jgi:hypothetical protein